MVRLFLCFLGALSPHRTRQWFWVSALVIFTGFVELAALGLLALFITSLTSLDQVMASKFVMYGKNVFGEYWFSDSRTFYVALGSAAISLIVLKNLLTGLHSYLTARFEGGMSMDAGVEMLKGFLEAPYVWSSAQNPSDIHSYVQWRVFVGYLPGHLMVIFSEGVISVLLFASLFLFEPLISMSVVLTLGTVGGGFFLLFRNRIASYGGQAKTLNLKNARGSLRNIQGLREVKAFNVVESSLFSFKGQLEQYAHCVALQKVFERATVWSLESIGFGGIIVGSILMIHSTEYSSARMMGTLSLLAVSAWRILPSVSRSVSVLGTIKGYIPYLQKVQEFLETLEGFRARRSEVALSTLPRLKDAIDIDRLDFTYDKASAKALSSISIRIAKGEMIGIIGHSGAGKSTLVDILTGFIEPSNGSVRVDGVLLDSGTEQSWRDQVGLVPQSPYLYDGTLAENIALTFSKEAIDYARVRHCCRLAGIDNFINDLPDGLDSAIGEKGGLLSGGQAQRVAIARALYREPQVLVFDEATSSLDDKNAETVRETIFELKGERTIIIIAHRLRAVKHCDRLIWLKNGRVVDCGPPEEILSRYVESNSGAQIDKTEKG